MPLARVTRAAHYGARYRDAILSQGSQQDETAMVAKSLGRAPTNEAFFAELK